MFTLIDSPITPYSNIVQIKEWLEVLHTLPVSGQRDEAMQEANRLLSDAMKRKTNWGKDEHK